MIDLQTPVPLPTLAARQARLIAAFERIGIRWIMASRPEHVYYLCGLRPPGPSALLIGPGGGVLIAPHGTEDPGWLAGQGIEVARYQGYSAEMHVDPPAAFAAALGTVAVRAGGERIGWDVGGPAVADDRVRMLDMIPAPDVFAAVRRPRDDWEIDQIRTRVQLVEVGLGAARAAARAGATELDLTIAAARAIADRIDALPALDHNVGAGDRSALGDPQATRRTIAHGELLLVDLYPALGGYVADLTRTWTIGPPSREAGRMHEAVLGALRAGEACLVPGTPVSSIDAAIRRSLRSAGGFDASMSHHAGHGVGLFAWEQPWIGGRSAEVLVPGDTIALEPGTYRRGFGGVRVEGNYLITVDGHERLDSFDEELAA